MPTEATRGHELPLTDVTDSCELPEVGGGNQT